MSWRSIIGVAATAGSYLAVRRGVADRVDAAVQRRLTRGVPAAADRPLAVATDLGSSFALAGLATTLALGDRRVLAARVGLSGAIAWSLAQAVKPALGRQRPYELGTSRRLVSLPAGSSWPSGHAALATAVASSLASAGDRRVAAVARLTAAGVAASRIRLGVHHLSDVVAGAGLGLVAADLARVAVGRSRRGDGVTNPHQM